MYCRPSTGNGGAITTVSIVKSSSGQTVLVNSNGFQATGNYQNFFSNTSSILEPGDEYVFTIIRNGSGLRRCNVIVDFNNDLSFELSAAAPDAETIYNFTSTNDTITFTYSLPLNAVAGMFALRIRSFAQNTALGICINSTVAGETEDYLLTIGQAEQCSVNITTPVTSVCFGDSLVLSASGADSYSWQVSPGNSCITCDEIVAIPLSSSVYEVVGISGQCSDTATIAITVFNPEIVISGNTSPLCAGDALVLSATTGFPEYLWSDGSNNAQITINLPGEYSVTAISTEGCIAAATAVVGAAAQPMADFDFQQTNGLTYSFNSVQENAESYMWQFGDEGTSELENPEFTFAEAGIYEVMLIVTNDCGSDTLTQTLDVIVLETGDLENFSGVTVAPNPFSNYIDVRIANNVNGPVNMEMYDVSGRLITSTIFNTAGEAGISDTSSIANGMYYLRISSGVKTGIVKLIKQ